MGTGATVSRPRLSCLSIPKRRWPARGYIIESVLIPRLLEVRKPILNSLDGVLHDGIRGNRFARAALDTALWDLEAARRGIGLAALLAERLGVQPATSLACGVALGIPQDRSLDRLRRWIDEAIARGYRRIKIKVAPGLGRRAGCGGRGRPWPDPACRSQWTRTGPMSGPSMSQTCAPSMRPGCCTSSSRSLPMSWSATRG